MQNRILLSFLIALSALAFNATPNLAIAQSSETEATPEKEKASEPPAPNPKDPKMPTSDDEETEPEENTSDIEVPEVSYDLKALPFPTRRMHELILEATKSGDVEKLRALIGIGDTATLLSLGGFEGDPVEFLKEQSGDDEGHEILAILEEVLEAGYVHLDKGTDREMFVWPYFFSVPLDTLTPQQRVELFRIVTYGDFVDFKDFGGYIFYRVGISPSGRWQFFVSGD